MILYAQYKWKLNLHQGVHSNEYHSVESIARRQGDREPPLRFWNSESRASGAGYIQLPVYFLSLSRLFSVGETEKTNEVPIDLTDEELKYCVKNYRQILSIQSMGEEATVGLEKLHPKPLLEFVTMFMIFFLTPQAKVILPVFYWQYYHLSD